jgi:hypothetical protein
MQPAAVEDVALAVLSAAAAPVKLSPASPPHRVIDVVGPQPVSYREVISLVARIARAQGRAVNDGIQEMAVEEAERRARAGGFQGMGPDTLDCLLCDEVADASPFEGLVGRPLIPLPAALETSVRSAA